MIMGTPDTEQVNPSTPIGNRPKKNIKAALPISFSTVGSSPLPNSNIDDSPTHTPQINVGRHLQPSPFTVLRKSDNFVTPSANAESSDIRTIEPPSLEKAGPLRYRPSPPICSFEKRNDKRRRLCEDTLITSPIEYNYSKLNTEFDKIQLIGSGSFADVWKVKHKLDGIYYAVKLGRKHEYGEKMRIRLIREAKNLAYITSKGIEIHVLRYFGSWIEDYRLALQTELCDESLTTIIKNNKKLNINEICKLIAHVSTGLNFLHEYNIIHFDIKPDNILECCNIYKIADFGLAILISDNEYKYEEGDCRYIAPELMKEKKINDLTKIDIFSLGCILYELLIIQELPKNGIFWHKIRNGNIWLNEKLKYKNDIYIEKLKILTTNMLNPNPIYRPTARDIMENDIILPYVTRLDILRQRVISAEEEKKKKRGKE
eukprot:GHVL01010594.1.p1 GENE.GHVL01010594.1~~GHVL01010594.1.p1  ORF type:complete len:430 (+),score=120.70 GHVL01010594.1:134-1423(+)